jgi:hypothetical protein
VIPSVGRVPRGCACVNDARACRSWAQTQNHVAHVTRSNAARPAHQVLKPTGLSILTAGPTDRSPSLFLGRAGHPARGAGAGPNAQGRARRHHAVRRGAERPRGARREGLDQDSSGNQRYQDARHDRPRAGGGRGCGIGGQGRGPERRGGGSGRRDVRRGVQRHRVRTSRRRGASARGSQRPRQARRGQGQATGHPHGARFPLPSVSISLVRELTVVSDERDL